ncbi:MAG: hypothetical protein KDM81_16825, partial [Verrucomicrobiae bacterium]|nr:hypothetical protein [Verrucomicrobiae bacterium]
GVGAAVLGASAAVGPFYTTALLDLVGEFSPDEPWEIVLDGHVYRYVVEDLPKEERGLGAIAAKLAEKINAGGLFHAEASTFNDGQVVYNRLSIRRAPGSPAPSPYPFLVSATRGGNLVKGVFDIDNANFLRSTKAFTNYLLGFFPVRDQVAFTASISLELFEANPQGGAPRLLASSTGSARLDQGSLTLLDPFIEYDFSRAGAYYLRVGSHLAYDRTSFLGLKPPFTAEDAGVLTGQSYDLIVSLQRHPKNDNTLELQGKAITIVEGTGVGQMATILGYDPEGNIFSIDRNWAVAPDATSRFEISATRDDFTPVTDSYDLVLTGAPSGPVVIDVLPTPTPTYNAALAFDASAAFGRHNDVQVQVATKRVRIAIGESAAGTETWRFGFNFDESADPEAHQALDYVAQPGETAAQLASRLAPVLQPQGFTVRLEGADVVITAARVFYFEVAVPAGSRAAVTATPQVEFTAQNWMTKQTVRVAAIDDALVDGSDALVFPAAEQRANVIRGPLTI